MSYATKCDVVCHRVPHHDHRGTSLPMSHPLSGTSLPTSSGTTTSAVVLVPTVKPYRGCKTGLEDFVMGL